MSTRSQGDGLAAELLRLYNILSPVQRRQFLSLLFLMLLGGLAELAAIGSVVPFLSLLAGGSSALPWLTNVFAALGAGDRGEQLIAASLMFMAAAVIAGAFRLQLAWSTQNFVLNLGHELAVEIQRRTLAQPYSYHVSRNSSEIIASLDKVRMLVFGVLLQLMRAVTAGLIAIFIVAALVQIDPFTAAVSAMAFGTLYALVSVFSRKRLARNSAVLGSAFEQRVQLIQESLGGIRDVIIDNSQAVYLDEFRKVDARLTRAQATTSFIGTAPRFIIEAAGMVLIAVLALAISGREGGLAQALPVLGAVALGAQRLLPLIQQIYTTWTDLSGQRSVTRQVLDLLELPVEDQSAQSQPTERLPLREAITFQKISFAYPGRHDPALEDISFTIERGSRVALIGQTGSGKSTLADLLMGLLEPTAGTIAVDGAALTTANRRAWQRGIAHVPQSIFLADASIARNIAFGVPAAEIDMEGLMRAARTAQLDAFIDSLPDGYETSVGERGVRLSGGQRQRLGIARAVYKDAPLLVLDEATSALDEDTEVAVIDALDQLAGGDRTIVIIAHRRSTIEHCDSVVRLENGRLVEVGTFAKVFERRPLTGTN